MQVNYCIKPYYNLLACDADMRVLRESGFFCNILTDTLFENWVGGSTATSHSLLNWCGAGTGNSTPTAGDSSIAALGTRFQKISSTDILESLAVTGSEIICSNVYISDLGGVVGNVAEIALFNLASGGSLGSRALTKDLAGAPAAFAVAANERLKIVYQVRVTVDLSDETGSFTWGGNTYNYTARVCSWNSGLSGAPRNSNNFWVFPHGAIFNDSANEGFGLTRALAHDNNVLSAVTSRPSFTLNGVAGTRTTAAYTPSSKIRKVEYNFGASEANLAGGIGGVIIDNASVGQSGIQIAFSPKIPKVSPTSFKVGLTHVFAR